MREFKKLLRIMKRLRHPRRGCPWDLKQTEETLKEYLVEETYELIEAIDRRRSDQIKEELGDLLLQIVFLATLQEEKRCFGMRDVLATITAKLINRHPHIFATTRVSGADEVRQNWEKIKMNEKSKPSVISDYPVEMPALLTANRIASQAATVGFDFNNARQALQKVEEEIGELKKELRRRQPPGKAAEEIGDLLFAVANVARLLKVNPEFALTRTNRKFINRFRFIEKKLAKQGREISRLPLPELERLWLEAKKG